MTKPDTVDVATSGSVDRHDTCAECGKPMLYRCGDGVTLRVVSSFCGNIQGSCLMALVEISE